MLPVTIEKATIIDLLTIQTIAKETFIKAFSADNTQRNMDIYVAESFNKQKIQEELTNPESTFYLATLEGQAIGYLKLNVGAAQTESFTSNYMEVERIYVREKYHGQQIGQALMNKAIAVATTSKKEFLWLGVWERNPKAIRFYQKNGFVAFSEHIFLMVDDPQRDILMKRKVIIDY